MKKTKKTDKTLSDLIVKWESLSPDQKREILEIVENFTNANQSTESLKLQSSFCLETKLKL